jgi:hypothetical protein
MKLKILNELNSKMIRTKESKPTICCNCKTGMISLSSSLCKKLSLDNTTRIDFAFDEESPSDWYIVKSKDNNGFLLKGKNGNTLLARSVSVTTQIADCCKLNRDTPFICLVGLESVSFEGKCLYPIITKSASLLASKKERRLAS